MPKKNDDRAINILGVKIMDFLTDAQAKAEILDIGRRMYDKNFVAANDGNISVRVGEDEIWATPTGVSKGFMREEMLVKLRMDGTVIEQGEYKPSSEVKMHLRVYRENPEVRGVTHAHAPVTTAFSIAGIPLDSTIYPEAIVSLGVIPVAPYALPGTKEVPDSIAPFCRDYNAVMLANHGALSWGRTLTEAWYRLEAVEHYAMILMYTGRIIGQANALNAEQVDKLIKLRENFGITAGGVPHTDKEK